MKTIPIISGLIQYSKHPLYKNSVFLISSHIVTALLGFIFWMIVTHLAAGHLTEPDEKIGLATALISASLLLQLFSRLGFDVGLIRFLPAEVNKPAMINTCFTIVGLMSMILAVIFILGLGTWSPALVFIREKLHYSLLFILFTGAATYLGILQQSVFVALRAAKFSLVIQIVAGIRLLIVIGLLSFGAFGIFSSWGLAVLIAFVAGIFILTRLQPGYRPMPCIKKKVINNILRFSLGNYIAESLKESPGLLMPILIVNVLEPEMGAYFYITWTVANVLFMISYATSFVLLAEDSYQPRKLRGGLIRAMKFTFLLLIPAIIFIFLFGKPILSLFGEEYSKNAFDLLRILALSGIPLTLNSLYITIQRVKGQLRTVLAIYGFIAIFTVVVGYVLLRDHNLVGIGIAWILSQGIVSLYIGLTMMRGWIIRK